jgi:phage gp29-like protein
MINLKKAFDYASRFSPAMKKNKKRKELIKSKPPRSNDSLEFENYLNSWISHTKTKVTAPFISNLLSGADEGQPREQAALFQTMLEKEPVIAAHIQTRVLSALACEWNILAKKTDGDSIQKAEEVKRILQDADFYDLLKHLLDAIGSGYSGSAIIWGEGGSRIEHFQHVHPANWIFDLHGNPALIGEDGKERALCEYHPNQFVFHTQKMKPGLPCRGGLLRTLVWLYFFKHYALRDRARYLERFGIPFVMAKVRRDDFDDDGIRSNILSSLAKMGNDGVGLVTDGAELQILNQNAQGGGEHFQNWCEYIDDIFALTILGQVASSKSSSGFSKGQIQENVRCDLIESDSRNLMETVNKQIIRPLERFKFGTEGLLKFNLDFDPKKNLKEKAEIIKILSDSGFRIKRNYIEKTFGLPLE